MDIQVKPVEGKKGLKQFVHFAKKIYKDNPYWVPPIYSDQMKFLDRRKGVFFEIGEAEYFMAFRDSQPVGRISAHVNHQYEKYHDQETGFFGFFECVDDQEVANALFEEATRWVKSKGKSRILGPMNFTLYDESGMLYHGFDSLPVVLLPYNPAYYNDLVVGAGFEKAIDWYAFMVYADLEVKPSFYRIRNRILRQEGLEIVPLDMKKFDAVVQDVGTIFRDAWMENWGHVPLSDGQLKHLASELKHVVVPELTYLAYLDGKCIGFALNILDANPALQKANGRLFPFGLFKILREMKKIKRLRTIAMGVLKEYRHRGIDIVFYLNMVEKGREMGFEESECSIIVETNTRMIRALEDLNAKRYKTYRFYQKEI